LSTIKFFSASVTQNIKNVNHNNHDEDQLTTSGRSQESALVETVWQVRAVILFICTGFFSNPEESELARYAKQSASVATSFVMSSQYRQQFE
jgi:hypothetical protein